MGISRRTLLGGGLSVAAVGLTGCVGAGSETADTTSPSPGGAGGGAAGALTLWHAYSGQADKVEFIDWALEKFGTEHPDIELNVVSNEQSSYKTKLQTAMASGNPPDVFYTLPGGYLKAFVDSGQVYKLDDELEKDGWGDSFMPAAMSAVTFDDSTYAVPIDLDAAVLWYNKKLFADKGWEVPTTHDEFITLCQTIKDDGIVPLALGNKDSWPATFWFQYYLLRLKGAGVMDAFVKGEADATFLPEGTEAGQMLQDLSTKEFFPQGANGMTDAEANILFMNGQAAMVLMGTWQIGMSADAGEGFELGFFPFPTIEGAQGDPKDAIAGVAASFAMSQSTADNEAGLTFLRFITSEEVLQKYVEIRKTMVTLTGATTAELAGPVLADVVANVIEAAPSLDAFYDTAMAPKTMDTYYGQVQGLVEGSITPEAAATAIDEAAKAGE